MKRGEIWTLLEKGYASKPRPVVIIQNDEIQFESINLCLLTSAESSAFPNRIQISPSAENGLLKTSFVITDKILTVNKKNLGQKIGILNQNDLSKISESLKSVLGIN